MSSSPVRIKRIDCILIDESGDVLQFLLLTTYSRIVAIVVRLTATVAMKIAGIFWAERARANGAKLLFALAGSVSINLVAQLPGPRLIRIPDQLVCSD